MIKYRNCKCECRVNPLWDLCLKGDCNCRGHKLNDSPTNEEIEKKKRFMRWAIERKKKNKLEQEIDEMIFENKGTKYD